MNILYCGDSGVCHGLFLSVASVCKNTDAPVTVYVLTAFTDSRNAISKADANDLQTFAREYNKNCDIHLIDITKSFESSLPLANMGTRFTPLCMLRLFADTVDEIPDKILYLDTDVLCRKDITKLYQTDMRGAEIAGVPDRYGKWFFKNQLKHTYLNSGVLLLDMKRIRESGLFLKCREMCRDKKLFMPDQTALNKLAKKIKLPRRFNEQGKIKDDTVLKHFTTFFKYFPYVRSVTIKPWDEERLHGELNIFEFDDIINEHKNRRVCK